MASQSQEKLLRFVGDLIEEGKTLLSSHMEYSDSVRFAESGPHGRWVARCHHLRQILGRAAEPWASDLHIQSRDYEIERGIGTLQGIHSVIADGLLFKIEDWVRGDTFASLLEQSEYLLREDYWLAAGVLARAVLEEHVRTWCERAQCTPTKTKPTINDYNSSLYNGGSGVIDKITMLHVQSMAAVGNDAAHNAPGLAREPVERLVRDVRDFLSKNPLP